MTTSQIQNNNFNCIKSVCIFFSDHNLICCFQIPLSGYGGTSNLILENVKKLSDSYMVTVNDLIPGKESRIVFSIRNTGSRAAFVKAIGFKDSQKKVFLDSKVLRIFPDKFVLKEKTQEVSIKVFTKYIN